MNAVKELEIYNPFRIKNGKNEHELLKLSNKHCFEYHTWHIIVQETCNKHKDIVCADNRPAANHR